MIIAILYIGLGIIAWIVVTAAPPAVAVACWLMAGRFRPSWAVHVLFIPFLMLIEWLSIYVLAFAEHDDGEGPPGLGLMLLPAFGLLVVSIGAYFCALLSSWFAAVRRRA